MNERTYLVALSPMLGQSKLLATLALSVRWQLEQLGAPPAVAELEAEELLRSTFVRNDNKSLLSSLNDMVFHAEAYLTELAPVTSDDLLRVARELSDTPHVNRDPAWPPDAARQLFGLPSRRPVH